ncbi:Xaa-Pro peptidase family protein [Bradyrhizobium sp. Ec3.3]|uniref:M24 family metallopeptidase n=1 Tax=Bradyrhizobium sp. Ec3.3 TaxID=189753 RepID=UPI001FDA593E|nr:Xaa-Pro peptidase family protein [Bradyrhizobium sp. Ec3.3]
MEKAKLPILLLHQPENIIYLTGFDPGPGWYAYHALVVPAKGDPILVVRDVEIPAAEVSSWVKDWTFYSDTVDILEVAIDAAKRALDQLDLGGGKIGVDEHSWFLTPERYNRLRSKLPHASFVAEPKIVDHLRITKSPIEIECIRKGAAAVEAGVKAGIERVVAGATERELASVAFGGIILAGGELPLNGVIISGDRSDVIHGGFTDRRLQQGEQIYFELNGIHQNYHARMMRTAIAGRPNADQMKVAETLIRIQDHGIALMKPGTVAARIDDAFRKPVLASGYRQSYTNKTGYSMGLNIRPSSTEGLREFLPDANWVLEPGMVFHMLLMAKGIGISETVLVTEAGPERITKMERKLFWNE